ncbi:hypothetical protein [Moorena sp. SIO3E8]|uniref:hypothetical protein n=1 Tax=Moorena sp. SIO3E8 TaxID=2607830 RepID=UPI0025DF1C56|nr:hypothetical protein [Moorena sp. SIO3E8]
MTIQKYNPQDQLLQEVKADNSIVYTGRELVAKLFTNQTIDPIRYIALGTGGSTKVAPATDTQLGQEVFQGYFILKMRLSVSSPNLHRRSAWAIFEK